MEQILKRKELNSILNKIRILRNRIFHYETIIANKKNFREHIDLMFNMLKILYNEDINTYIHKLSDIERFNNRIHEILDKISDL